MGHDAVRSAQRFGDVLGPRPDELSHGAVPALRTVQPVEPQRVTRGKKLPSVPVLLCHLPRRKMRELLPIDGRPGAAAGPAVILFPDS